MSKIAYLSALSMLAMAANAESKWQTYNEPETDEQRKRRISEFNDRRNRANGLNLFQFGDHAIWALNEKSAIKKLNKLKQNEQGN
jgi:hypothetical protein